MFIFAFIVSIITVVFVLLPLLVGKGGQLASASSQNSPERLKAMKEALLKRYIEDEKAFDSKAIPKLVWDQRKQFLTNRYIDAARRLDYINDVIAHQANPQPKPEGV
ncbi:MAG: hypothetical protein EOP10_01525 [Proteobacteria bacterium]|nr:MAG: hypothetical protein EOP10_01525 [Pseudomonadota bacterium]